MKLSSRAAVNPLNSLFSCEGDPKLTLSRILPNHHLGKFCVLGSFPQFFPSEENPDSCLPKVIAKSRSFQGPAENNMDRQG